MRFSEVELTSIAAIDAPHRVTSAELETRLEPHLRRLGFAKGVIASLSGVNERRFWDEGAQPSEVAARAGDAALRRAGIPKSAIGALVSTSVCRDFVEPSTACLVHGALELSPECVNYDLSNACLGFINGMDLVARMIERGEIDHGMVVDGEGSRHVVERTIERLNASGDARAFAESFATLTLGSGSAAVILSRKGLVSGGHRYVGSVSLAATEHRNLCRGKEDWMVTDGQKLLAAGLELARRTFARAEGALDWTSDALSEVVIHQVSRAHTEKLAATLGIDPRKIHAIYPDRGNVGPASVPMVLAEAEALGRLHPGGRVGLLGIGSGLNCTMAEIVW